MAYSGTVSATGTTSLAFTMPTAVAVGDVIIVVFCGNGASTTGSCSDSLGNTYTAAGAIKAITGGFGVWGSFKSIVTVAGTPTVTVASISGSACAGVAQSYAGPVTLDGVSAIATGTTAAFTAGSITTVNANDILVGIMVNAASSTGTFAASGTWAQATFSANGGSCRVGLENQTVAATGSYAATGTVTAAQWEAYTAAFTVASAAVVTAAKAPPRNKARFRASLW